MNQVIAFRLVQGVGGGIVMTCSCVSIADLFLTEDRGKFVGVLGAIYAVATVVGPVVGAFIAEWLSWHWVFLFIAVAGAHVLGLTAWIYPRSTLLTRPVGLDYPGMAALVLAVAPVALALAPIGVLYSWDAPRLSDCWFSGWRWPDSLW